ncbi:hypothetical protein AZE42_02512 [Rhizopogon vesiculosus]|uniref:SH3 domain-containing protein n=1 Tax=Rhizopogon vesiculosus TaxID=180088 RepID=A0A1J8RAD0_9AGAM|nr:hypothetical protein AZE42_02512 [Rhizopogon vesiculosus]
MSARRQPSTTSLAKYARTTSPDANIRSLDFCNSFWGVGDGGVDVLFARMRGAARTMEELKNFWKERSAIEEDYAKRMAKLAKMPIGKDEIGELRNSVDTLRLETDKQAGFHLQLSQQMRNDLEGQATAFSAKQQHHKKTYQAAIEKEFKVKQTREQHATKAREKYEADCLRINSYTAQSTLVQGKDLEKIHLKLERAQQTVQVNENEYAQFSRVLQETMQKWEQDWKAFCDSCQDLEEERMEFMKDNMWAYANSVSTVCVSDDESCEKMRLALEQMEPEKEMENFVRDYATGSAIPEPPAFVNYTNSDPVPSSSTRIATHAATFARASHRSAAGRSAPPPEDDLYDNTNHAGVGAIGGGSRSSPAESTLSRSQTQRSQSGRSQVNGVNGHVSPSRDVHSQASQRRNSTASALRPAQELRGDPMDPTVSNTQLVIGGKTWDVDPNNDPQQQRGQLRTSPPVGEQDDPLVRRMAELSTAAQNVARHPTVRRDTLSGQDPRKATTESLSAPSRTNSSNRDFRNSAEIVVGAYPLAPSRSASPNPPKPVLAAPPPPSLPQSSSNLPVEQVLDNYGRTFPGEQRPRSRANSYVGLPPPVNNNQNHGSNGVRPASRGGYPGVGTQNLITQPPAGSLVRAQSISQRPVTPNNQVGIALGPDGRVVVDHMAQPPRQPPYGHAQLPGAHSYSGYNNDPRQQQQQQQPPRTDYGPVTPYAAPAAPQTNYGNYNQQSQRPQYDSQHVPFQPPPPASQPYINYGPPTRNPSIAHPSQGVISHPHQQPYYGHNTNAYRAPSPAMTRTPSPQLPRHPPPPTGAYTDDGRPILFYVKALYDYGATIDEEFDFQAGDIIAVTDTPEDGWWSGELLDEARRQAGRHVFPSNFVCLF